MSQNDGEKFTGEVDSRLSELFGEMDPPDNKTNNGGGNTHTTSIEKNPVSVTPLEDNEPTPDRFSQFTELKSILLSIEWEISDEIMQRLIVETDSLQESSRNNPLILLFLKLLGSVGKYIGNKKANAHPDSIRLLHSIYAQLENVLMSSIMTESEVKRILADEVKKFKTLKQKLIEHTVSPPQMETEPEEREKERAVPPEEETANPVQAVDQHPNLDLLAQKIDEIEKRMQDEINNLRELLNSFRE
ncbi:hypothetical protein ACFLZL_02600 [Thermodesulfobacteriota bacterium]